MEANSSSNPRGVDIYPPSTTQSTPNIAIDTHTGNKKGGNVLKIWEHYTKFDNGTKCK